MPSATACGGAAGPRRRSGKRRPVTGRRHSILTTRTVHSLTSWSAAPGSGGRDDGRRREGEALIFSITGLS